MDSDWLPMFLSFITWIKSLYSYVVTWTLLYWDYTSLVWCERA